MMRGSMYGASLTASLLSTVFAIIGVVVHSDTLCNIAGVIAIANMLALTADVIRRNRKG